MSGYDRQREEQLRLQYLRMRRMITSQRERERFLRRPYDSVLDIHQRGLVGGNLFGDILHGIESVGKTVVPFVPLLL